MLDDKLKTQLKAYLEKLVQPIELVASLDDGDKSRELDALLHDIASMSEKISLRRAGTVPAGCLSLPAQAVFASTLSFDFQSLELPPCSTTISRPN